MDDFDIYAVNIDAETVSQDFDDIDLFAEHTLDYLQDENDDDSDILFQ